MIEAWIVISVRRGRSFLAAAISVLLVACGSGGIKTSYQTPHLPAARSPLVPPDLIQACPIQTSTIETLTTKGTGLAFNGARFGTVGTYTYVLAEASASVSSNDPCAATIVDLKNAGDRNGRVHYAFDVVILHPTELAKANGTLLYEVVNRGTSLGFAVLNDGTPNNLFDAVKPVIPTSASAVIPGLGAGNGFLMNRGVTVVWSGWQGDKPQSLNVSSALITSAKKWYGPGMSLPVALDKANNNAHITGQVQDEFIASNAMSSQLVTNFRMAPDTIATAYMTVQKTATSTPVRLDSSLWNFVAAPGNRSSAGEGMVTINHAAVVADKKYANALDSGSDKGSIFHFNYTAIDPKVMGLGFLATRDLISFLRYQTQDTAGHPNPLAGRIKTSLAIGISQSGRYLRDFLWQGFNTDAQFRPVFDGLMPMVGGSRKTYTNYRWAKPGDFSQEHETHYTPGDQFPFAYATITDPLTGKMDGLLQKCSELRTCPKVFQYDSPIEFTSARASLLVTNGAGKELAIPEGVRLFYAAGTSHTPTALASNAALQPDYSVDREVPASAPVAAPPALVASTALVRALFVNLEGWVNGTARPLPNNYPLLSTGTLALPSASPASIGAPDLSAIGLDFTGHYNTLSVNDDSVIPVVASSRFYVVHLPIVDALGNDKAGIKMPDIAVPLATFRGNSPRKPGFVAGIQFGLASSQRALAMTPATRLVGDPRKTVEELYPTRAAYVTKVRATVDQLVAEGYLLNSQDGINDADDYNNRALMQSLQTNFLNLP